MTPHRRNQLVALAVLISAPFLMYHWQLVMVLSGLGVVLFLMWHIAYGQHRPKIQPPELPMGDMRTLKQILADEERSRQRVPPQPARSKMARPPAAVPASPKTSSTINVTRLNNLEDPVVPRPPEPGRKRTEPSIDENPRWVPLGESLTLPGGITIAGGGFYVGSDPHTRIASLIDPRLPVRLKHPDWAGKSIDYYPTYKVLTPEQRGSYLGFLASERSSTAVGLSYVFIYLYGLEYRLLVDLVNNGEGIEEGHALIAEVRRLRSVYGQSASLRRYADALAEAASIALGLDASTGGFGSNSGEASVALVLGRHAQEKLPVSPELAFAWARQSLGWPGQSHIEAVETEAAALFALRYRKQHGDGLLLQPGRAAVKLPYVWAAPGMGGRTEIQTRTPTVLQRESTAMALVTLLQGCIDTLNPLRRARRSKRASLAGELSALPAELRDVGLSREATRVSDGLSALLGDAHLISVPWNRVAGLFGIPVRDVTKRTATELLQGMGTLGFGIEPDVRFFAPLPDANSKVQLFRLPNVAPQTPSPAYASVLLMAQAAVAIGAVGGELKETELKTVLASVERQFALSPPERLRIEAHLAWLKDHPISPRALNTRLSRLDPVVRQQLADVLIDVAGADGQVSREEVVLLEKLYQSLGLDPGQVASHIHRSSVGSPTTGHTLSINAERVAQKLEETARVQSVLAEIFADEPAVATEDTASSTASQENPWGVDAAHATLLSRIMDWPGVELECSVWEQWCDDARLLPGGAIEQVNDVAFEVVGEALIEDTDPLEINEHARSALREAHKA